jgi:outer membrane protein OmpA-like peptidoglycan-associated protein
MYLHFLPTVLCATLTLASADDDTLPAGTKFHVADVRGNISNIDASKAVVNLDTAAPNRSSSIGFSAQALAASTSGVVAIETDHSIVLDLSADVLFDFDRSQLLPSADDALHNIAGLISLRAQHKKILVEGYTDSKGSDTYNKKLSTARAEAVRAWFIRSGVDISLISVIGRGAENPVAPNKTIDGKDNPSGRQKNRRVQITIDK